MIELRHVPKRRCTGTKRRKPVWMTWKASKLVKRKQTSFAKYKDSDHPSYKLAAESEAGVTALQKEVRKTVGK